MRANHNVNLSGLQVGQDLLLFARILKTAEHRDANRKRGEAAPESIVVLIRQHGCGREDGHLLRVSNHFERGAHGHFRLAITNVAAKQTVHGLRALQVAFHVHNGAVLIGVS